MPKFIDTRGLTSIAIAVCARCNCKFPYSELMPDPNYPALFVCKDDLDVLDPYRLPAREAERIDLDHPRPDVPLVVGTMQVPVPQQVDGVTQLNPSVPWTANTVYAVGNQVTPGVAVGFGPAGTEIWVYVCILAGTSGAVEPNFPTTQGEVISDGTTRWLNIGLYLP